MKHRVARRAFNGIALALVVIVCSTDPTPAAADTPYIVPTKIEAWYHAATTPAGPRPGVPAPPVSQYPAGTLHVGIAGGNEDARTYLSLDATTLPAGAEVTGGTLTLPVDQGDGTLNVETAAIDVCVAPQPGPAVAGSLDTPPAIDCSVRARPAYHAETSTMSVDLAPFADRLRTAGLALVPSDAAEASAATWHVAFFGQGGTNPPPASIAATLAVRDAGSPAGGTNSASGPLIYSPPGSPHPGPITPTVGPASSPEVAPPSVAATTDVGSLPNTTRVTPVARVVRQGFRYSVIFLVPLALLAFAGYFATALTRDPAPRST